MNNKKQWLMIADQEYDSINDVYQNYKKKVDKSYSNIEQQWVDDNLQIVIDFMGDEDVWKYIIPDIELYGVGGRASARNFKFVRPISGVELNLYRPWSSE